MLLLLSSDPSINPHNLIPVFRAITGDWDEIIYNTETVGGYYTVVPEARAELFCEKFSVRDQLTEAAATYYALYHHNPNWKELCHYLYRAGEIMAVQIARPHVQTVAGKYSVMSVHIMYMLRYTVLVRKVKCTCGMVWLWYSAAVH